MDDLAELPTVSLPSRESGVGHPLDDVVGGIRTMLGRIEGFDPYVAGPDERAQVVRLRQQLMDLRDPVDLCIRRIDSAYQRAFAEHGTKAFPLDDGGAVKIERAPNSYRTNEHELRRALIAFVPRLLTQQEVDEAMPTVVTVKPNHTKLNALRNRGDEVSQVIDSLRETIPGSPLQAKVVHPVRGR